MIIKRNFILKIFQQKKSKISGQKNVITAKNSNNIFTEHTHNQNGSLLQYS